MPIGLSALERPLDLSRTGLLVIDMQNAFCHREGTLALDGANVEAMQAIVPRVRDLVECCRQAGIRDFWSLQQHLPDDRTRDAHRVRAHTRKRFRPPSLRGTWDAELLDPLKPFISPETHVFVKHRFSCFYNTTFESLLRMSGIDTLLLAGVATTTCVESTARDAYIRDLDVIVVSDCVASFSDELHRASLVAIERYFGALVSLAELVAALGPGAAAAG